MVAQFDMARIVDLIRLERGRAAHCASQAQSSPDEDEKAILRTAAYWHTRTADLIEKAIPAAKNWRQEK